MKIQDTILLVHCNHTDNNVPTLSVSLYGPKLTSVP